MQLSIEIDSTFFHDAEIAYSIRAVGGSVGGDKAPPLIYLSTNLYGSLWFVVVTT